MSSLEDGFGGGVDDMVSANTAELQIPFWEVGYHGFTGPVAAWHSRRASASGNFAVPWCQIEMNGTERTVPEATPQLGFSTTRSESHGLYYDMHVAATTLSECIGSTCRRPDEAHPCVIHMSQIMIATLCLCICTRW